MSKRATRICRVPDESLESCVRGSIHASEQCAWMLEKDRHVLVAWSWSHVGEALRVEAHAEIMEAHVSVGKEDCTIAACLKDGSGRVWTKREGLGSVKTKRVLPPGPTKARRSDGEERRERLLSVCIIQGDGEKRFQVIFGTSLGGMIQVLLDERGDISSSTSLERGQVPGMMGRIGTLLWGQEAASPIKQILWKEKECILLALTEREIQIWSRRENISQLEVATTFDIQAHMKQELGESCMVNNICISGMRVFVLVTIADKGLCAVGLEISVGQEAIVCSPWKLYVGLAAGFWSGASCRDVSLRFLLSNAENESEIPQFLLLGGEGRTLLCMGNSVNKFTSCYDRPVLDACASRTSTGWLLLDPSAGLMCVPIERVTHLQSAPGMDAATSIKRSELAQEEIRQALSIGAGIVDFEKASNFRARLTSLGAFSRSEGSPFVALGKEIVDTLFKHWGGEDASLANVGGLLQDKKARFHTYLEMLSTTGCFDMLRPEVLSSLFSLYLRIDFLLSFREAENLLYASQHTSLAYLKECLAQAGEEIKAADIALASRPSEEVTYSRVSSCDSLLSALQKKFSSSLDLSQGIAECWVVLEAATGSILGAIESSSGAWKYLSEKFPSAFALATGGSCIAPWLGSKRMIAMLTSATDATLDVLNALISSDPEHVPAARGRLLELVSQLLDSHRLGLESASVGSDAQQGLFQTYSAARDSLLAALLEHSLDDGGQEAIDAVATLAVRHHGYACLAQLCETTGDEEGLFDYMRHLGSSSRFDGKFCVFYFQWLLDRKREFELMHLPDEFDDDLLNFLQPLLRLRWMQEIKMKRHASAGHTLGVLANESDLTVKQCSRRLSLQKLALLAGGLELNNEEVGCVDNALSLLDIQMELLSGTSHEKIMSPVEIIDAAMQETAPAKLALAFAVFAAAGNGFCRGHLKLLEAAWRAAADLTDWEELAMARVGDTDESYLLALEQTAVYRAALFCYGHSYIGRGAPFSDVLNIDEVFELLKNHTRLEEYPMETLKHALLTGVEGSDIVVNME